MSWTEHSEFCSKSWILSNKLIEIIFYFENQDINIGLENLFMILNLCPWNVRV